MLILLQNAQFSYLFAIQTLNNKIPRSAYGTPRGSFFYGSYHESIRFLA